MTYKELYGVRKLVVAEVLTDGGTSGYTTGMWNELAGVQNIAHAKTEASETHYYDNISAIVVDSEGSDEVTLTVAVPENKTRALLEGVGYDTAKDMIIRTPAKKKYFALGYIEMDTEGKETINILYKGKFSGGNKTVATKTDGVETNNIEYTFTAIHTSSDIDATGTSPNVVNKPAMAIEVPIDSTVGITEVKVFGVFTAGVSTLDVMTPTEIKALTA